MNRPVHFDVKTDDPNRAMAFYKAVFDWKFDKWDGPTDYWLITTGPADALGINGGLSKGNERGSWSSTVGVDSVDAACEKVAAAGGEITVAKMPIPGVGWLAFCKDTEGNVFGIKEDDPEAK